MTSLLLAKYIIKDIANKNKDGIELVRGLLQSYKEGPSAEGAFHNAESFRDLFGTFRQLNEMGKLDEVEQVLHELDSNQCPRESKRRKIFERAEDSHQSPRSPSTPPPAVVASAFRSCSNTPSSQIRNDQESVSDETPSVPLSPCTIDDNDSLVISSESDEESTASESDLEDSDEGEEEVALESNSVAKAFHNTYFTDLFWPRDAQTAFTMKLPDWSRSIQTISRMGELLEAPKTVEAAILLRISCKLMEDDFEAQDLVNIDEPVFEEFWKRGRAVCTCIMQGGKTRRAIFLRGLVHAGVHKKHAVVLANGMAVAYNDMRSSMEDLNSEYQLKIPERIRNSNKYLPSAKLFLGTRLNQNKGFDDFYKREINQVHFNIRLSNVRALESLSSAFKNRIDFNRRNTHLILDESHEALGGRQFSKQVRDQLARWKDVTLVTATPEAQFVAPELLGDSFRRVSILPRAGYYLYGPNEDEPNKDEGNVLVVDYEPMVTKDDQGVSMDDATTPFPREYFPVARKGRKRKSSKDEEDKDKDGVVTLEATPCSVPDEAFCALDKMCRFKRSFFCIILNNHIGREPDEGRKSINVGHGVIAKWFMQHASALSKKQKKKKGPRASVVTYTVYQYSTVSSEFGRPRLFFNETFMRAIARIKRSGMKKLLDKVLTADPMRSNDRVLVTSKALETITEHFEQAAQDAWDVYENKRTKKGSHFICYRTKREERKTLFTFSLRLPRLEIKAVLSIIRFIHESRFKSNKYNYDTAPLQLGVVGSTLLKQSVNVESKCRQLQSTHLMYLRKPNEHFDLVRLLQKLGRVDHGLTDSPFFKSAFGGEEDPRKRRPTVMMTQQYIDLVLESPRRQRETAEQGHKALVDFFRRVKFLSTKQPTIMSGACAELKSAEAGAYAKTKEEVRASDQACDELKAWVKRGPAKFKKHASKIAEAIAEQLVQVGNGEEAEIDLEGLREIFDCGDHGSRIQKLVYDFLQEIPEIPVLRK
ncbi:Hypothetical Protein FCC1311_006572 [Hondaea fermentalgiana]|uniref:Uncharacterized protein n=1 Tax=Hondaea fermentalgiana TaxID=2315210 RepID=A0A2R5G295_9STRA|nr:Hypothetical Protein FCC1311_006572 [Hondaea fermentalgiana]|eukprot:GBG24439.1 Hypothetical Protein FCC1311_006572 [Hondaea fermentalgiana]